MPNSSASTKSPPRDAVIQQFLTAHGFAQAVRDPIPGDASFRRYERVRLNERRYILMDAPPDREDVRPFITVAEYLTAQGFSAPHIIAKQVEEGLLLLEDLGDALYTRLLRQDPKEHFEEQLYIAAVDVLTKLHTCSTASLNVPIYTQEKLLNEALLLTDWFLPQIAEESTEKARQEYVEIWQRLLPEVSESAVKNPVAILRDYHADNLLWLPEREGVEKVGLLDFQDAVIGHPAYDLVSLLEDARRDVSAEVTTQCLTHYLHGMSADDQVAFRNAYAVLGAQRNCKIVGIFVRLLVRDGKPVYLKHLPRVWGHLAHDLSHPALAPLRQWMDTYVPLQFRGEIAVRQ